MTLNQFIEEKMKEFDKKFPSWYDDQGFYLGRRTINGQRWKFLDGNRDLPKEMRDFLTTSIRSACEVMMEQENDVAHITGTVTKDMDTPEARKYMNGWNDALSQVEEKINKFMGE